MATWERRLRGAIGMGLTWALLWGPAAVLLGILVDPDDSMDEMWVAIGAFPGFLGGVLFAIVLGLVAGRRRFDELSTAHVAGWGAVAGLLLGVLPSLVAEPTGARPRWLLVLVLVGTFTLLCAASAAASLALARRAERRDGGDDDGAPGSALPRAGVESLESRAVVSARA